MFPSRAWMKGQTRCEGCNAVDVWQELEPVKTAYLAMQTQWLRDSNNIITGFNYASLDFVMEFNEIAPSKSFFKLFAAMERETLNLARVKRK